MFCTAHSAMHLLNSRPEGPAREPEGWEGRESMRLEAGWLPAKQSGSPADLLYPVLLEEKNEKNWSAPGAPAQLGLVMRGVLPSSHSVF